MNPQEVRKQGFEGFKKRALLVFTTALRAPLMLMMGCGHVKGNAYGAGVVHDYDGIKMVTMPFETTPVVYDKKVNGPFLDFFEVGDFVINVGNTKGYHAHPDKGELLPSADSIEYRSK